MEVLLYNSNVCRLCGEENDNGTLLFRESQDNDQNLSKLVNSYLPLMVYDDGKLPRTICPGCSIQLEATVEFLNLIINGQKVIRELYQREKEYKKSLQKEANHSQNIVINGIKTADGGLYRYDHPMALQISGVEKPKRKRGRPPKKIKTPEELAQEEAEWKKMQELEEPKSDGDSSGKRRRKAPTRFSEVVQGKELERIFKEEGVIDADESDPDSQPDTAREVVKEVNKEPEVIGHLEKSGELVIVTKGKGRGRPKGRMKRTHEQCAICGMEFSCVGHYMSHVAAHGPVRYQCAQCEREFATRIDFTRHQVLNSHEGQNIIYSEADKTATQQNPSPVKAVEDKTENQIEEPTPAQDWQCQNNECEEDLDINVDGDIEVEKYQTNKTENIETVQMVCKVELKVEPTVKTEDPLHVESFSVDPSSVEPFSVDPSSVEPSSVEPFSVDPSSVDPSSVDPSSVDPSLADPSVLDPSLVKPSPVEPSPKDPSQVEPSPQEESSPAPTKKVRLKCNLCDKTFGSKQSKSIHIKAKHKGERNFPCNECGLRFAYPRSLALHKLRHRRCAQRAGYACDLCGKVLNHPSSVVYHKEAEHSNQRYICGKCGKQFKHKQLLQRHQVVHSQLRPYSCKQCDASFKTKTNLLNHQLLHSGVKRFPCELCKQRFSHKTSLTLHMRWHTGVKPFACETCGKRFTQKGNLSEHERIHTGEKPYQCGACPRRFTTSSQHRLHRRRHAHAQEATPTRCTMCGKRFATRSAWLAHERLEAAASLAHAASVSGEAGVDAAGDVADVGDVALVTSVTSAHHVTEAACACDVCGRVCTSRWALRKHARRHTGERPFRCPHCPRAFSDCSNLSKHKKKVHKQISLLVTDKNQQQAQPQTLQQTQQLPSLLSQQPLPSLLPPLASLLPQQPLPSLLPQQPLPSLSVQQQLPSLLPHEQLAPADETQEAEEQVIFVTYDDDEDEQTTAYHILDPEQEGGCVSDALYAPTVLLPQETHLPVTDEEGNQLHFTMQDGTRLAITSADGKSLQVVTEDGQTIPVEINGFNEEEDINDPNTIVHQLNIQKRIDPPDESAPVTHYYTII